MLNNAPLVAIFAVAILAAVGSSIGIVRLFKAEPLVKPCPNRECGAKKVAYDVRDDGDYVIETLAIHTSGQNKLTKLTSQCHGGGSEVRKLKPRYCAAAREGGRPLQPDTFLNKPPYLALYHDQAYCRGSYETDSVQCWGAGKPTTLEPRKGLSAVA